VSSLRLALEGDLGYAKIVFSSSDLEVISNHVREQWLCRIRVIAPDKVKLFETIPMDRYHEIASLIDHRSAWPKIERCLEEAAVNQIRQLPTFMKLTEEFGDFTIGDEEGLGRENIYWRLVRPDSYSDVGPLHADKWFWDLGHGITPDNMQRVKVWLAIHCESGISGFRLVPGSHRKEYPYRGELRDGIVKPIICLADHHLDIRMFDSKSGDAIVFNDRLLHGGAVGGSRSRVSIEFTMFVDRDRYFQ